MRHAYATLLLCFTLHASAGKNPTSILAYVDDFKGTVATLTDADCSYSKSMLAGYYEDKDTRLKAVCWFMYKDRAVIIDPLEDKFYWVMPTAKPKARPSDSNVMDLKRML